MSSTPSRTNETFLIYSTSSCSYCKRAKELILQKGGSYVEHYIDRDDNARKDLFVRLPTAKTVPQIFTNGQHIGGYTELAEYYANK